MKLPQIKLSISIKLMSFVFIISVLPLLTFQLSSYSATRHAIIEEAVQHSKLILANQRDYLSLQMGQIDGLATNLGSVEEINQVISASSNVNQNQSSSYDLLATKARIGYVLSSYNNLRGLVSIDLFTQNGTQFHVGESQVLSHTNANLRDRLLQRTFENPNQLLWHGVEENINAMPSSQKVITATKAINLIVAGKSDPIGMLLINFSTDYLHRHFSQIDLGANAYLMIVDAEKRLIFHPNKSLVGKTIESSLSGLLQSPSGSLQLRLDGQNVVLSYIQIPDKNWYLINVAPKDNLLAPMKNIERIGIVLLVFNLLLIALFIRLYNKQIVVPIRNILDGFKLFQSGKIDDDWRLKKQKTLNEINELVEWFNAFLDTAKINKQAQTSQRIASMVFESHMGMVVTDVNGIALQINHAATALTGYSAEEVVGNSLKMLQSGRHNPVFYAAMWEAISKRGLWQGEIWNKRKNGEIYPQWLTISAVKNDTGAITHYVGTMSDMTERKALEGEIQHLAFYDTLTQLPNRRLLHDRLMQAMTASKRSGRYGAVMFLDLDNFKPLNDLHGHDVGDLLLIEAARRITSCVRDVDTAARFGGDEFVVMLSELDTEKAPSIVHAKKVAEKIRLALAEPYRLETVQPLGDKLVVEHHCTSSIGVTVFFDHACSTDDALKWADIAMYQAKESGRNQIKFYE